MKTFHWSSICPGGESLHLASVKLSAGAPPDMHQHDFFECFLVESNRGSHLFNSSEVPLHARDLYFVRPEHGHGLRSPLSTPLVFTNVALCQSVAEPALEWAPELAEAWSPSPQPRLVRLNPSHHRQFLELIELVAAGPRVAADGIFFLAGLARLLRPIVAEHADTALPDWMRVALPLASEPENLRQGTSRLYHLCGRSPEHVSRSFQKHLHVTPSDWLNRERINAARRLLETSQRSVLDVALDCGFESPSYFHRRFKMATGLTPLHFRRRAHSVQNRPPSTLPKLASQRSSINPLPRPRRQP